jgi:hypothetical protein
MTVNLTQEDLVPLVMTAQPSFRNSELKSVSKCGYWDYDKYVWHWDIVVLKWLSERELWDLYQICKEA